MAQLLVFQEYDDNSKGVLGAASDGSVRKYESPDRTRHQRRMLWSFVRTGEGDWGMLVNHQYAKVLLASTEIAEWQVKLGIPPRIAGDRSAWWKMAAPQPGTSIVLVPYNAQAYRLTCLNLDTPATLAKNDVALRFQAWYTRALDTAPYVPLPSFDDVAIDETFYNFEIITLGGNPQNKRLYLTVEEEKAAESAIKIGTDPKATAAQFRLVPVGTGRIISDGRPLITAGFPKEERVYAYQPERQGFQWEIEMINLSGSRTFVSGDHVALRTGEHLFYIGWKSGASTDLTASSFTPRENETFTIEKVDGNGQIKPGEIKPGDRFALLAGNGRHLTDDRGSSDRHVTAAAPHIAAWETFVLGTPAVRAFRIYGKQTGHPLTLGERRGEIFPLVHRFGRTLEHFELVDRGDAMITMRHGSGPRLSEVAPATDGGVEPGQSVGIRELSTAPGIFFRLQVAPPSAWWPDAPDLTMEKYRDPVEDTGRMILGGAFAAMGTAVTSFGGIPGGAAIFTFAFDLIYPKKKVSQYDLFNQFRKDILREVGNLIATHAVFQAQGALENARAGYLVDYLNSRREHMDGGRGLAEAMNYAINAAKDYKLTFAFLSLEREGGKIKDIEKNLTSVRSGLPVYAQCAAEYVNALQETALLHAYQPELALPDVWLRTRDQYVTATPAGGVRYATTSEPLKKALRVLERGGSKQLKHGAKVILRSPASTNITAAGGGGGALAAMTPSHQIGAFEIFTIERVSNPPAALGDEIKHGDTVALKASNGTHYVSAPDGGGPLTASAPHRAAWETFKIEIHVTPVKPKTLTAAAAVPYAEHITNLRTHAAHRYNEAREMFEFLVNDRVSKKNVFYVKQMLFPSALWFRDEVYGIKLDEIGGPNPPRGWDDPENATNVQWGLDGYREYLRRIYYYFKYRYFYALRPLLTIADETQKLCDQMWSDPLMATEYSYVARTTPEHEL